MIFIRSSVMMSMLGFWLFFDTTNAPSDKYFCMVVIKFERTGQSFLPYPLSRQIPPI